MTLRQWLQSKPFTLSMSSGFFSFFAHCGMLSALESEGLTPAKITGSSAGALVGACWASGCSSNEIKERLFEITKNDFWDPSPGLGLLKGVKFRKMVSDICKVDSLQNCRIPVAFSVFDLLTFKTHTLTEGKIQSAVSASCAFPLLFQPVKIGRRYYLDGGIKDRPGLSGVVTGERVFYHHISSRSPWRRKNSRALNVPQRENMQTLSIKGLPRVGPNTMEQGQEAYRIAKEATLTALDVECCIHMKC
jgi:NTE family protein